MEPNQEVPYPPGFFPATATNNVKHCFKYNTNTEQEMNFNDFVYFHSQNGNLTLHEVEYDIPKKIVANPKEEQHRMDKLMMVNEAGEIFPAHLPNIADIVGKPEVQAAIRELEKDDVVEYEGTTKIIPKLLVDKMDPKPIIPTSGPVYSLGLAGFITDFGSYTDDVIFLQNVPVDFANNWLSNCGDSTNVLLQNSDEQIAAKLKVVKKDGLITKCELSGVREFTDRYNVQVEEGALIKFQHGHPAVFVVELVLV
ncbi:uncharacterized protein LOC110693710 isoform X1 [Chenopodium quinoa]|uniref:uncharacterized protein LOC110693710 isoform X1 n=1 Tax=Chenopodium quinoa TaxID=63459 RepID=UPI000B78397B|nr:uncharacterized protein LOC110693710 isoform X1 [Chenopodium quinoa]